jgi:hypothetical protein
MIKVLQEAVERVKTLSEERQAYAAEVLEQIAGAGEGVFEIPDEHRAAVHEGKEQAARGKFADEETVARVLRRSWD